MREGVQFLREHREIAVLGLSWALFLSAMMTGVVVTAPLADQILHKGAVGYGWLNGGWGMGAFVSAFYAPMFIKKFAASCSLPTSLELLAVLPPPAPLAPPISLHVSCTA